MIEIVDQNAFSAVMIAFVENEIAFGNEYRAVEMESLGRASLGIEFKLPLKTKLNEVLQTFGVSSPNHDSDRGFHVVSLKSNYTNARSVYFPLDENNIAQQSILTLSSVNYALARLKNSEWYTLVASQDHNKALITQTEMTDIIATTLVITNALHVGFSWNSNSQLSYQFNDDTVVEINFDANALHFYHENKHCVKHTELTNNV